MNDFLSQKMLVLFDQKLRITHCTIKQNFLLQNGTATKRTCVAGVFEAYACFRMTREMKLEMRYEVSPVLYGLASFE